MVSQPEAIIGRQPTIDEQLDAMVGEATCDRETELLAVIDRLTNEKTARAKAANAKTESGSETEASNVS